MKFNLTFLEIVVFLLVCFAIIIWMKYGRKIRRWLQDYFRRRRGPRNLKPKSPKDCPLCNRHICFLPHRSKPEVVPWSERKSPRGRPKTVDTRGHACLNRGPSKRRYRTPAMAAKLVRHRWSVRDLLQLPVPEGVWLDTFPATKGC